MMECNDMCTREQDTSQSGMSVITASRFLKREFPQVKQWMCWIMDPDPAEGVLRIFMGEGIRNEGQVGGWRWSRVPCNYPDTCFWGGDIKRKHIGLIWIGMLRIQGPNQEDFLLFSYLREDRSVCKEYLVSTGDVDMLRRFARDLGKHFRTNRNTRNFVVNVVNGPDIYMDSKEDEPIYLQPDLQEDIEKQVYSFFENGALYKEMKVPYRRGLLFTGAPGTGKTLMVRRLLRECHKRFKVGCHYLSIRHNTDEDDLARFFRVGDVRDPALLVLEEIDAITRETRVTRANLLAELDGLEPRKGVLVIGTTNNPEHIDAALVHRPSRFDRVWTFPLPDAQLRYTWMKSAFAHLDRQLLMDLARRCNGWTFAYLKELRMTAAVLALNAGHNTITADALNRGHQLLARQFKAGRRNHAQADMSSDDVGFAQEEINDLELEEALVCKK